MAPPPADRGDLRDAATLKRSLVRRIAGQTVVLGALTIVALTTIAYVLARAEIEQRTLAQLASTAASKEDMLERQLQADRDRTRLIAHRPEVERALRTRSAADLEALVLELSREGTAISGIAVFGREGGLRAAVGAALPALGTADASLLVPVVTEHGWEGYAVAAPLRTAEGGGAGVLVAGYEHRNLFDAMFGVGALGRTAEVLVGREQEGNLVLLRHRFSQRFPQPLDLGSLHEQARFGDLLARAVLGEETVSATQDYEGKTVLAASRSLPNLGWGIVVQLERSEALAGAQALAGYLLGVGAALLVGTCVAFVLLARRLAGPLRDLAQRLVHLGPGHWRYRAVARTGDEVEVLDRVAEQMSQRLERIYDHLEEEVRARTEELREQYERDRTILESIEHGIVVVDARGRVLDGNPAARRMAGVRADARLAGYDIASVFPLERHGRTSGALHPVRQCLLTRAPVRPTSTARWSLRCEGGTLLPVAVSVTPILQGRKLLGAIAVVADVTEERRIDYMKSEFISLASHQLRTPLSTVQWYIELLGSERAPHALSADQRDYLREMDRASKRMVNLVDALLRAARLEGGAITPDRQNVDLRGLVEDVGEELRSLAKDAKIACTIAVPKKKVLVDTDPVLLHVVLQNLFSNAVKYTRSGGQVSVQLEDRAKEVVLSVEDTGVGIPRAAQPRIFEKLFRAENVRTIDTDGNGLGLYISRIVVESLGGKIAFRSTEGKGSTFTIVLPKRHATARPGQARARGRAEA